MANFSSGLSAAFYFYYFFLIPHSFEITTTALKLLMPFCSQGCDSYLPTIIQVRRFLWKNKSSSAIERFERTVIVLVVTFVRPNGTRIVAHFDVTFEIDVNRENLYFSDTRGG